MDFPIYRKYKNLEVWFKISSTTHFIEYKKMGAKFFKTEIKAKIYPEIQFINDMINCYEDRWEITTETAFNDFINDQYQSYTSHQ